jgi:hypothetical protein
MTFCTSIRVQISLFILLLQALRRLALLEAMRYQIPCLVADAGGGKEVIKYAGVTLRTRRRGSDEKDDVDFK